MPPCRVRKLLDNLQSTRVRDEMRSTVGTTHGAHTVKNVCACQKGDWKTEDNIRYCQARYLNYKTVQWCKNQKYAQQGRDKETEDRSIKSEAHNEPIASLHPNHSGVGACFNKDRGPSSTDRKLGYRRWDQKRVAGSETTSSTYEKWPQR